MTRTNNIPPVAEERNIEQQTIQELREQITALQNELTEQKRHADKMDDLAVEYFETLKDGNKETNLTEVLKKRKEIKELKEKLEKEKNQAQQKITDLEREKEQELNQKNDEITRLKNEIIKIEAERDARLNINITLNQWNNDYKNRPTQQQLNDIQQENSNLQSGLNRISAELNNTKNERDNYQRMWNNHTCPSVSCSRSHCNGSCLQKSSDSNTKNSSNTKIRGRRLRGW